MQSTVDRTSTDLGMAGGLLDVAVMATVKRPEGEGLTACDSAAFAALWRETARKVTLFLRRMGASPEVAEDLVQDVAVRLLRTGLHFAEPKELLKWSYVVARHLYIDHVRRPGPLPCELAELPEPLAPTDVVRTVEARLALAQVGRVLRTMSDADQQALLQLVRDDPDAAPTSRRESTRLAVQRHRARTRLQHLIASTAALIGVLGAQLRRLGGHATVAAAYVVPLLMVALVPLPQKGQNPVPLGAHHAVDQITSDTAVRRQGAVSSSTRPNLVRVAAPPATGALAETSHEDAKVQTPVPGLAVRSGTTSNPDHHLVCVGIGDGLPDVCVNQLSRSGPAGLGSLIGGAAPLG